MAVLCGPRLSPTHGHTDIGGPRSCRVSHRDTRGPVPCPDSVDLDNNRTPTTCLLGNPLRAVPARVAGPPPRFVPAVGRRRGLSLLGRWPPSPRRGAEGPLTHCSGTLQVSRPRWGPGDRRRRVQKSPDDTLGRLSLNKDRRDPAPPSRWDLSGSVSTAGSPRRSFSELPNHPRRDHPLSSLASLGHPQ